jgi:hypothetical protein
MSLGFLGRIIFIGNSQKWECISEFFDARNCMKHVKRAYRHHAMNSKSVSIASSVNVMLVTLKLKLTVTGRQLRLLVILSLQLVSNRVQELNITLLGILC